MIQVVAGIILNTQNKILIALRPPYVAQGGLWEFPGGKLEPGETTRKALIRELREEIGITVISAQPFAQVLHYYPEQLVELSVWWVDEFIGQPHGKEGQSIKWVTKEELSSLNFPAANQSIIRNVQKRLGSSVEQG